MLYCPTNQLDDPPYKTWAVYKFQWAGNPHPRLSNKTLCMAAKQGSTLQYNHYDLHSMYGWSESGPTYHGMQTSTGKRGLVLSRSTFVGSGAYAGHWLGDNSAQWADLQTSIIGIVEFNMFGIPYIGADICGFFGDTNEELCLRWQQAGAFYSFTRNHNSLGAAPQHPTQWPSVANATRQAINFRYHHLPYLYTLFSHAAREGHTVLRPLFFEYPLDPVALNVNHQFLWGGALLITPVLNPGASTVKGYFPNDTWYSIYDFDYGLKVQQPGTWITLPAPNNTMIPVHIRGGYIVPRQAPALTTQYARQNPLELLVAAGSNDQALGDLFWDDGEVISWNATQGDINFFYYHFHFFQNSTQSSLNMHMFYNGNQTGVVIPTLDIIEVLGCKFLPDFSSFAFDGKPLSIDNSTYNVTTQRMFIQSNSLLDLTQVKTQGDSALTWNNK